MTKQDYIESIANWAGDLQIIIEHTTETCWREEVIKIATQMAQVVEDTSNVPIMISGFGVLGGRTNGAIV